ncbi:hydroxymethylglutaryl-CoA synthase [Nocardia sp. CDC159]|uniref:Hydroxymethylglutaryl-CoA synthase n=1 Tax=Nocardia pulmonis TaxID=2951408 RepID=A0A9X2EFD7_9NOCA|nr:MULTISPECIES: hydroxymethylglutaryl-CoA synthase [Nocardia]MCM6778455.1 hydroxymethylglutaryl-CoA synthase [Nocardia pulmonis]MCM6791344.1 hydroxymethylglutaryl-CoA synthase [Nocardia sp. CDC159]
MTAIDLGIHDLSVATTHYVLDLAELAAERKQPLQKFTVGLGQEQMSVPAADEDIVTMAAAAAAPILERHGTEGLRSVLLATESGVDEAKAAALYLHRLIGLPDTARVVELKQACYAGTAAVQFAAGLITRDPDQRVLVIATDIARYDLDSAAEPTQGAGAVAMLISANPGIMTLDPWSGIHSSDVMDFWRPTYRSTAVVDGRYSISAYLDAMQMAWTDYRKQGGREWAELQAFCYHQPFTKMAYKAHRHLLECNGITPDPAEIERAIGETTRYNRMVGNSYTASLYLALASLLDSDTDLADRPIALASYGSGCVAEFLTGTVSPDYRRHIRTASNRDAIARRERISYGRYRRLHEARSRSEGMDHLFSEESTGSYRLAGQAEHRRIYQTC